MSNIIHESTDNQFTIAEMYHLFSNHDTIIFRLEGMGQTVSDTVLFKEAFERIEELERLATQYESNKRYIELGKAVEKAFGKGAILVYDAVYGNDGDIISYNYDEELDDLLEWAEGRE